MLVHGHVLLETRIDMCLRVNLMNTFARGLERQQVISMSKAGFRWMYSHTAHVLRTNNLTIQSIFALHGYIYGMFVFLNSDLIDMQE